MALGFLTPDARLRVVSDLSVVLPGAKLNTYVAGTPATPLATCSDSALTVPNANPVVASAGGLFGPIYLTPGVAYKLVLTDAANVVIWSQDNVLVPVANALAAGAGISLVTVAGVTTIAATATTSVASISQNDFRLTLESGVSVSSTDQLAKTTLYLTPHTGNRIDLYDAAGAPTRIISAEVSIALPAVASQLYDVFGWSNAGVLTLELLAWTNDTARATALTRATTGAWTKTGDLTRRYLGSVRTTTVAGQSEDSGVKRYVWNASNRVRRVMVRQENTSSWTYTIAANRQANANALNQLDLVVGLADSAILVIVQGKANNSAGGAVSSLLNIGEDSTTVAVVTATFTYTTAVTAGVDVPLTAHLVKVPAVGRHYYAWLEQSGGAGTTTWGNAGGAVGTGMSGWIEG
jgi:hypothetical protein